MASAAVVGLIGAEACSDAVSDGLVDAGTMLVDAGAGGGLLDDAGRLLIDAGAGIQNGRSEVEAQIAAAFKSGSRIKMRSALQTGADGSQVASVPAPYDTMLNTRCAIQAAADNKLRCLPDSSGIYSTGNFADSGCTQRLATQTVCWGLEMPTYLTQSEASGVPCGSPPRYSYRARVFKLGAEHSGSIYTGAPGACAPASRDMTYRYFLLGAEVPAGSFVEFTEAGSATL